MHTQLTNGHGANGRNNGAGSSSNGSVANGQSSKNGVPGGPDVRGDALLGPSNDGDRYELGSPIAMPKAGGFLWNQKMMIHFTCRGYATAQFMQPEPAKYSHVPNIEAKTFMQPEQNYYAHHPGRFVYVKDDDKGELLFSAPYEPVRQRLSRFVFSVGKTDVSWLVEQDEIRIEMQLQLPTADVAELWTIKVTNLSSWKPRKISIYPHFTIGYMSWMNQSAEWDDDLCGIVGSSITPYQKATDYFKNKHLKDKTYFLCETPPISYECKHEAFEGEGGLHAPSAITQSVELKCNDARYETPTAVVQYQSQMDPMETREYRFLFGPANNNEEIRSMKQRYLSRKGFGRASREYREYILRGRGVMQIHSPDEDLDNFVNHWLPRQVFYHGDVNRLTTDPQTRNYLQDNMGMSFVNPRVTRKAILTALSQQEKTGAMPDGVLLAEGAELKYINQIPHTDHCVWLPVALEVYLSESGDYDMLKEKLKGMHGDEFTVAERMSRAMNWLLKGRDERGLSYIAQGDWCDPMNMVGYKGKGVSGWLTVATAYALNLWANICDECGDYGAAKRYRAGAGEVNAAANQYLWDGDWFARGITDDNTIFGVKKDPEGRIWLNPQAWSILGGAASPEQRAKIYSQVDKQLGTPYGVLMFAPPYTAMREDVGRVTQKFPGQGENGAVYNHAGVFYVHALYTIGGQADRAYKILRQMLPGPDMKDFAQRGQLPVYIPNYYRGGWKEYPDRAGRSSQLFNTGTASWAYRCFIEGLCGLKGVANGLRIKPQLPSHWDECRVKRLFRGAVFEVEIRRGDTKSNLVTLDGEPLEGGLVTDIEEGETYEIKVLIPYPRGTDGVPLKNGNDNSVIKGSRGRASTAF